MKIFHSETHKLHRLGLPAWAPADYDAHLENPQRVDSILAALQKTTWAEIIPPGDFGLDPILAIHTQIYLDYLKNAYHEWKEITNEAGLVAIPYTQGIDSVTALSGKIPDQDGFFMTDLKVPITSGTYPAALASAQCALSAAQAISTGSKVAFGLCRPPGHHAGAQICGGFCYLNNAAIAAQWLSRLGRVAILDIDFHAGNGTQAIFYDRPDVLTISLHADPTREYPTYAGYAHETGSGPGFDFHHNFPLPSKTDDDAYCRVLGQALSLINDYSPTFLVLSAGFDTFVDDPLSDLEITRAGFSRFGRMISDLHLPTAIILEGGYNTAELGNNVVALLNSFIP
jgi:acetoin utilization deacetylase AcuC-like enzyme